MPYGYIYYVESDALRSVHTKEVTSNFLGPDQETSVKTMYLRRFTSISENSLNHGSWKGGEFTKGLSHCEGRPRRTVKFLHQDSGLSGGTSRTPFVVSLAAFKHKTNSGRFVGTLFTPRATPFHIWRHIFLLPALHTVWGDVARGAEG